MRGGGAQRHHRLGEQTPEVRRMGPRRQNDGAALRRDRVEAPAFGKALLYPQALAEHRVVIKVEFSINGEYFTVWVIGGAWGHDEWIDFSK